MILQTCQAQWNLGADNDCWKISDEDNNILLMLPPGMELHDVADIRRFAMNHEKMAFDEGMEAGKQAMLAANRAFLKVQADKILVLEHMNEELSSKLQRFFIEEGEED